MLQADQMARQARRLDGEAQCPQAKVPSYQDLLDAALDDTFPASDPLAISAGAHVHEPRTTPRDCQDWTLRPGACKPAGQPGDGSAGHERSARTAAHVHSNLVEGDGRVPQGACWIEQTAQAATLSWEGSGGALQSLEVSVESLRQWLASGALERFDEA